MPPNLDTRNDTTGPADEWMSHYGIEPCSIICAVVWYSDGTRALWDPLRDDADGMHDDHVQLINVFFMKNGSPRAVHLQAFDEYWLPGSTKPLRGRMLGELRGNTWFAFSRRAQRWEAAP